MKALEFQEGDRTFTCKAESSPATPDTLANQLNDRFPEANPSSGDIQVTSI